MPIRITGMNSGLDTEAIISELVKVQKTKVDTLKKSQTRLNWKQEAWKDLNSKIFKLFNKTLNNMRYQSSYLKKTTTVSNSKAVSVVTGENAMNGVQSIRVEQIAEAGYLTGAKIKGNNITNTTKLGELDADAFKDGNPIINITVNGKFTDFELTADTTIGDVTKKLKSLGLNANFDEKNQRFFVIAKEFGQENDFSITASNTEGSMMLKSLGLNVSLDQDKAALAEYTKYADYYVVGDKSATLDNMRDLIDAEVLARTNYYKTKNEEIVKSREDYLSKREAAINDPDYDDSKTAEILKQEVKDLQDVIKDMDDGDEKSAKMKELAKLDKQYALAQSVEEYDSAISKLNQQRADNDKYIATTVNGDGSITISATAALISEVEDSHYNKAAYAHEVISSYVPGSGVDDPDGAHKISGQDSVIYLNGGRFTSTNSDFEINGLTITALEVTGDEKVTITTKDDTDGIYNMVKDFLKEYNSLIIEMDKLYGAEIAKGYEPLTDEEKKELSESEVEKWEEKVKDSILRRDMTIGSISSSLKTIMLSSFEVGGKRVSLSDFGINTLGYFSAVENEKNAYHIDGDPDDDNTSNNSDKLKTAIVNDTEGVMNFFASLTQSLYTAVDKMISGNEFSSYGKVYNDKLMKTQYDDYTKKIAAQEKRMTALEDKWYKKFSAMETALARLQKNQSAISSLLGG